MIDRAIINIYRLLGKFPRRACCRGMTVIARRGRRVLTAAPAIPVTPAGAIRIGPELAADSRVADHEVNRVRDFGRIDEPLELRVREDVLFDVLLPQRRTIGVSVKPG